MLRSSNVERGTRCGTDGTDPLAPRRMRATEGKHKGDDDRWDSDARPLTSSLPAYCTALSQAARGGHRAGGGVVADAPRATVLVRVSSFSRRPEVHSRSG